MSLALALALQAGAPPRLPAHLGDHALLQREARTPIWGWVEPGETVTLQVSWDAERVATARADGAGRFELWLVTPGAGGPHTLAVSCAHGTRTLSDVLLGELWLASGQSNMEWTLGPRVGEGVAGWEEAARTAADPELRLFEVANELAPAPREDVRGSWRAADPTSAAESSAVAYFFARALRRELGVPVGVLMADWGGTPAEAWTPAAALGAFPEFAAALAQLARGPEELAAEQRALQAAYWRRAEALDAALGLGDAAGEACDDSGWETVALPRAWEDHGLAHFDGLAWYRREVILPPEWAGAELVLELGPIDDRDTTSWNGVRIGGQEDDGRWETPRRYVVPGERVRAGANLLAVRVLDTGGLGGFFGAPEALRVARRAAPEEALPLAGPWRFRAAAPLAELGWPPSSQLYHPGQPSVLWNAMIAPLAPSALAGVIWYQGEANVGRAAQYERLFPTLIDAWRGAFRRDFPFLYVQIAPFAYGGDTGDAARLRDAQRRTLARTRGTGMAVTMDIGDPADIHPLEKRAVGERLALLALARRYARALEDSGPLYRSHAREGAALRVAFDHARGLTARGEALRHLALAGADGVFHPAEGRVEGESLLVTSPAVPAPVHVRLGWGAADQTNLWNAAGLPAASFRSDDG
ncbi:MAG TPA: sialate O-acetylesterase [Planctomycetota bacterium]